MSKQQSREYVPKVAAGLDLKSLDITPFQAFVFSRVDGQTSVEHIALSTGFDRPSVEQALAQLAGMGALRPMPPSTDQEQVSASTASAKERANQAGSQPLRQVEVLFERLPHANHYELLGVDRSATRSQVKDAYYTFVNVLHPDRFFGRDLGEAQTKVDQVFQRLTEAHDTLTKKRYRAEYDASLARREQQSQLDRALDSEERHAAQMTELKQELSPSKPPEESAPASIVFVDDTSAGDRAPESRRRGLARKLRTSLLAPPPATQGSPRIDRFDDVPTTRAASSAPPSLRGQQRLAGGEGGEHTQVQRYLDAAEQALHEDSPVSAANTLRLAHSLRPSDPLITSKLKTAEQLAARANWRENLKQAERARTQGRHHEAGVLFSKVALGNPEPDYYEKAALCFFEVEEDLRRAADCAKHGLELAPDRVGLRLLLGKIYTRARMTQSAISQLQHVLRTEPDNAEAETWLKNAKSTEH